jgi:hypothetical protein
MANAVEWVERGLQSASTSFCLATFKRRKRRAPSLAVHCPVNSGESSLIQPNPTKNNESHSETIYPFLAG